MTRAIKHMENLENKKMAIKHPDVDSTLKPVNIQFVISPAHVCMGVRVLAEFPHNKSNQLPTRPLYSMSLVMTLPCALLAISMETQWEGGSIVPGPPS